MMGKTSLDLSQGTCRHVSETYLAGRQHLVEETMASQAGGTAQLCQGTPVAAFGAGAEEPCGCPAGMRTWLEETLAEGGVQELVLGLLEHIGKQRLLALLPRL